MRLLGNKLRLGKAAVLKKRGLSQYELAELSGVTQKTIYALEHDKNNGSVTTVELLSDALDLSIDEYVGHEVTKSKKKVVV